MIFRTLFLMLAVLFTVSACASTDADSSGVRVDEHQAMTGAPLSGTEVTDHVVGEGPVAGTQQDLVVNVGDRVFFGYDRYDLTPEAQHTLGLQAEWLKHYMSVNITIEGHCDERGTREYNLALGERRANAVKNYLVALGIAASRVNTISYGKERPAVLGSDDAAWAQNRRGVAIVN